MDFLKNQGADNLHGKVQITANLFVKNGADPISVLIDTTMRTVKKADKSSKRWGFNKAVALADSYSKKSKTAKQRCRTETVSALIYQAKRSEEGGKALYQKNSCFLAINKVQN